MGDVKVIANSQAPKPAPHTGWNPLPPHILSPLVISPKIIKWSKSQSLLILYSNVINTII